MSDEEASTDAATAEDELRRLGVRNVRVDAVNDGIAWLSAPTEQIGLIAQEPLRTEVVRVVQASGFDRVGIWLS